MSAVPEPFRIPATADTPALSGLLTRPQLSNGAGLALTHGAGSNCESVLLASVSQAFANAGFTVLRFNLAFRQLRPHGPPTPGSAERDQAGIVQALAALRECVSGQIFLGGHSYGGRQATIIAAKEPALASSLLLLSYPLHPPNRPTQLRTAHFPSLRTPSFFVQGTRDGFGSIDELSAALQMIPARTQLSSIDGVGHELLRKKNSRQVTETIVEGFLQFVATQ